MNSRVVLTREVQREAAWAPYKRLRHQGTRSISQWVRWRLAQLFPPRTCLAVSFVWQEQTKKGIKRDSTGNVKVVGRTEAWRAKHEEVRVECGVGSALWTPGRRLDDVPTEPARDLLDLAYQVVQKAEPGRDMSDCFVDISQDGKHRPWCRGYIRSITTSTKWWSFKLQRALLPEELLQILGFDGVELGSLSKAAISDLLAESIALPCLSVVLGSMVLALPDLWGL